MKNEKLYQFYALSASDSPQNYRYVGVTSKSINSRFSQHKYCATHPEKCGLPVHKWMSSVYKNGGKILYTKIDECPKTEWENKEIYWISEYKKKYNLLNLDKGGKGVITSEKRSKSSLQRSAEKHYKKIVLFDKLGTIIDICESSSQAVEKYNLSRTAISNVLKGRSKTTGGYYIVYFDDYNSSNFDIQKFIQEKTDSTKTNKLVYRYDLNGVFLECFNSQQEVHDKYGFDCGSVRRAIKNKTIFKESYWTNTNTINIIDFEKEYKYLYNNIKFKTLHEIAEYVNLKDCTISNALRENRLIKGCAISRI